MVGVAVNGIATKGGNNKVINTMQIAGIPIPIIPFTKPASKKIKPRADSIPVSV